MRPEEQSWRHRRAQRSWYQRNTERIVSDVHAGFRIRSIDIRPPPPSTDASTASMPCSTPNSCCPGRSPKRRRSKSTWRRLQQRSAARRDRSGHPQRRLRQQGESDLPQEQFLVGGVKAEDQSSAVGGVEVDAERLTWLRNLRQAISQKDAWPPLHPNSKPRC